MRWYADNSELNGIKGAEIPDILLFGGVIASADAIHHIRNEVQNLLEPFGSRRAPLKWNFKDLRPYYERAGRSDLWSRVNDNMRDIRTGVFDILSRADCALLVSGIEGYSEKRDVLKKSKESLSRYVFTNGLMRFGLHVKAIDSKGAQVVLDWPDKGQPHLFNDEYAHAFTNGKTSDGAIKYTSGKLSALGFDDAPAFCSMESSQLLQVADLVVGATREFIECCLGKKKGGQGIDCLRLAREKWRGAPRADDVLSRGLAISSGSKDFRAKVLDGLRNVIFA